MKGQSNAGLLPVSGLPGEWEIEPALAGPDGFSSAFWGRGGMRAKRSSPLTLSLAQSPYSCLPYACIARLEREIDSISFAARARTF